MTRMVPQNPWLGIPLADYEGHMSLPSVGQAAMLSEYFARLLARHAPRSVAVVGCAGGNGFQHISPDVTSRVVAIDINPQYVEELRARYAGRIPGLELHVRDIEEPGFAVDPVDLVYAGLLLEYVEVEPALRFLRSACTPEGVVVIVLQLPSAALGKVSPTPYTSLQALGPVMRLVSPDDLRERAARAGLIVQSSRRVVLSSGKEFECLVLQRVELRR